MAQNNATPEQVKQAAEIAQRAHSTVQYNVYLPTLLRKVASAGLRIETEADALKVVETAAQLRAQYEANTKSASTTLLDKAHRRLFGDTYAKQAQVNQVNSLVDSYLQDQGLSAALDIMVGMEG